MSDGPTGRWWRERAQRTGEWQVGEPLPFGLYETGDSALD